MVALRMNVLFNMPSFFEHAFHRAFIARNIGHLTVLARYIRPFIDGSAPVRARYTNSQPHAFLLFHICDRLRHVYGEVFLPRRFKLDLFHERYFESFEACCRLGIVDSMTMYGELISRWFPDRETKRRYAHLLLRYGATQRRSHETKHDLRQRISRYIMHNLAEFNDLVATATYFGDTLPTRQMVSLYLLTSKVEHWRLLSIGRLPSCLCNVIEYFVVEGDMYDLIRKKWDEMLYPRWNRKRKRDAHHTPNQST